MNLTWRITLDTNKDKEISRVIDFINQNLSVVGEIKAEPYWKIKGNTLIEFESKTLSSEFSMDALIPLFYVFSDNWSINIADVSAQSISAVANENFKILSINWINVEVN